jgi:DNA adenine methylase
METYHAGQAAGTMTSRKKTLIRRLPEIQERLKGVILLNQDYKKVVKKYDSPSTFFYLDPPYVELSTREYKHKTINLEEFVSLLKSIKGKFLLSYNDHPKVRQAFQDFHIRTVGTTYIIGGKRHPIQELVISNF